MSYATGNEVPENYHLWSALSALSAIVSRRVWVDLGYFQITANLYVVLVGPPGNGKTTAMNISKDIIRELGTIPYSADAQTKESITKEMKELERAFDYGGKPILYTPYACFVTELSHFLGPSAGHMIDFLTTVYDQKVYDCKTKNKGNDVIVGPYVTLLGCTTNEWITTYLRSDIISGGFSRRAIFVNETANNRRISFPEVTAAQKLALSNVLHRAKELGTLSGPFRWTETARQWYDRWYQTREISKDPTIRGYSKTKPVQLLKVAMLTTVSETNELVLTPETFEVSLAMLDSIEEQLPAVFQGMGRNELAGVAAAVMDVISSVEYIPRKQLEGLMFKHAPPSELFVVLKHLQDSGQITILRADSPGQLPKEYVCSIGMTELVKKKLASVSAPASKLPSALNVDLSSFERPPEPPPVSPV